MTLSLDSLDVQSFPANDEPTPSSAPVTNYCKLTDDDFTCMWDYCGSGAPAHTCYDGC